MSKSENSSNPSNPSNTSNTSNQSDLKKYMDKILKLQEIQEKRLKLQENQEKARTEEFQLLREHLADMTRLLEQSISVAASGSTIAASKKYVPFHTGSQEAGQLLIPPANPDDYPTKVDIYQINGRVIPHMTLINDGPGEIFFITSYAKNVFNEKEGHLNVNDQRELFNVFEIRLRSTLPTTTFRLIEGIFRTGSTAPQTKINTEIRPTLQTNEIFKNFGITFDNQVPTINITSPTVQTLPSNYSLNPGNNPPLPPGATATLVDFSTGLPMPFLIPPGFILELFGIFTNFSTNMTFRSWVEIVPGTGIFTLFNAFPFSQRGILIGPILNVNFFSSQFIDPLGAPVPGRFSLITVTNDDPFNNAIGDLEFNTVLKRIT